LKNINDLMLAGIEESIEHWIDDDA